jgi:DNA-binding transcriptional regulator YiaG
MEMMTPKQIRELRLLLGMTGAAFAERLNVAEDTVWKWERGVRHPKYRHMEEMNKLADESGDGAIAPRKQPA